MQQRLRIAAGLLTTLQGKITGRPKRNAAFEIRRHVRVCRIPGVLLIDHLRHALESLQYLICGANAVIQPVRDVLAGDAQCSAILHQAGIGDVRHFRATDTLIDPAHDIAEDALRIVIEFRLDVAAVS